MRNIVDKLLIPFNVLLKRQVAKELKRIRALQEDKENKTKGKKEKKKKAEEEAAEEEMGLQGASADDQVRTFVIQNTFDN